MRDNSPGAAHRKAWNGERYETILRTTKEWRKVTFLKVIISNNLGEEKYRRGSGPL